MFTEEPSQQITPLPEERAEPPELRPFAAVQSTAETPLGMAWLDVAKAVGVWVISVVFLVFIPVFYALPYFIYRVVKVGAPSPEALASDKMLIFFSVAGILPTHLLTLVVIWLVVTNGGRRPFWKTIGFDWPQGTSPVMGTMVSVLVAIVLFGLAMAVTFFYGDRKTDLDLMIESSVYTRIATAFVAFATAPLVEELIYRGVLYSALEKAAGPWITIAVVSLLFAGVHVWQYRNNIAVIAVITLLSITLTVARAVTRKVLPSFIIHLVFNGIQSVLIVAGGFVDKNIFK